jgi:23S rRNA pseudouridine1911/1915/1917 synthase
MILLPPFTVIAPETGHTLAKVLRSRLHESQPSWADVRKLIENRRVKVGDSVCTDSARRLSEGELVTLLDQPAHRPKTSTPDGLVIRHLDDHVVVVEKPAGINTVRHPSELQWSEKRRELVPTLQDVTQWAIAKRLNRPARTLPPLRIVHRLDKETSGLICFARSPLAERVLGMQFRKHTVVRRYLTLVAGYLPPQSIRSMLVRDRGDGRRGSTTLANTGKEAITHVSVQERLKGFTLLSCRLETGRTHQIRIHLSEAGHPVCGDKVYCRRPNGTEIPDPSAAPRLALHATELGFDHPAAGQHLHWEMPPPPDLANLLERLRSDGR